MDLTRRDVLRMLGTVGVLGATGLLTGCAAPFADTRLRLATGGTQGVYYALGSVLGQVWRDRLALTTAPDVLVTGGSVANLNLLGAGAADVAFSQMDTAADQLARTARDDPRALRALARIYDEVVHIVVPAASTVRSVAELRGLRVSVGALDSGVSFTAARLLGVAGISPTTDLQVARLSINESVVALRERRIDAFFWNGGLPTAGVTDLASTTPIRLLDLSDLLPAAQIRFPEYTPGTIPARSYGSTAPVTAIMVRSVLLVPADMPDDLAERLVGALFADQARLAQASEAALTIDTRSAIGTQPVPLHPGAERFYRSAKTG